LQLCRQPREQGLGFTDREIGAGQPAHHLRVFRLRLVQGLQLTNRSGMIPVVQCLARLLQRAWGMAADIARQRGRAARACARGGAFCWRGLGRRDDHRLGLVRGGFAGYPLRQARLLRRFRFGYRQGQRWLLLGALAIQRYFQPELPAITGRFEAITHLKALGQADEQHLYLIAVRFHSPGQTLPLGLYPATARLAVQLDAAQLQADGTALIGALITDGTIEQQLQDEPRAIVLRQYFQQARVSAYRNDRSDGLRLDLDRLGGPRGQQRQRDARQHQRSDHQQPTPQTRKARP